MNTGTIRGLAGGAVFVYLALCVLAWSLQTRLLYPGAGRADVAPSPGWRLETLEALDGVKVHALELDREGATWTVVYFHGNGEVVGDDVWMARELQREGFSVVLVEYRGYGHSREESAAAPSEAGLYADAEAVLDRLAKRGVDAKHVVLWGASLGSGVAAEMAARGRGGALVLVTPYTSIVDVAACKFPWLPVRLLLRDRFDTLSKVSRITVPTLVFHGTSDEVVPYAMGQRLADALPHARFLSVQGGHHGDLFLGPGVKFFEEVGSFVRGVM